MYLLNLLQLVSLGGVIFNLLPLTQFSSSLQILSLCWVRHRMVPGRAECVLWASSLGYAGIPNAMILILKPVSVPVPGSWQALHSIPAEPLLD